MLTWDELAEVAAAGVEIGNHSLIHHPLDVLPPDQLRAEVTRSHDELEQRLGVQVRSFAYPHGYNGGRVRDVVEAAGTTTPPSRPPAAHPARAPLRGAPPAADPDHTGADLVAMVSSGGPALIRSSSEWRSPAGEWSGRRPARPAGT